MNHTQRPHIRIMTRPQGGLLERIVFFVLGAVILVAAFFFIGIALIAGAILAVVLLARWWWLTRRLRREQTQPYVDGEYTVIERAVIEHTASADERHPPER